jgi:DNA-binding ferritin-like protein
MAFSFIKENLYDNQNYVKEMVKIIKKCAMIHEGNEYAELAVLLGFLRALGLVHQSHHWQTTGNNYYGDHLLFERLYNDIPKEIDVIGEKIVGTENTSLTNYFSQMHHMETFLNYVSKGKSYNVESYRAELMFVISGEIVADILKNRNVLTIGLEQAIGNILDKHEEHLYLLQQRNNT